MAEPRFIPFNDRHGPLADEARQAIIEHCRTMKEQRAFAAANRERIDAEWEALEDPTMTAEQHIASLRDTDPVRWAELNAEWTQ